MFVLLLVIVILILIEPNRIEHEHDFNPNQVSVANAPLNGYPPRAAGHKEFAGTTDLPAASLTPANTHGKFLSTPAIQNP